MRSLFLLSAVLLAGSSGAGPASDAPMTLTASDGTGLRLTRLEGRATVQEPLAFTELHLQFTNPADRTVEGQFKITLPQGATVSRFAMNLDGRWQEGEVVERQAARRAYEDFLHRRQDPALLEQSGGNEFTARVFPIPARGVKDLIISYSQELSTRAPYRLPLRGLPEIAALDVTVTRGTDAKGTQHLKHEHFVPDSDFVLEPSAHPSEGLRNGNLLVARVKPISESEPDPIDSLAILVDTSASRVLGFNEEVRLLQKLVEGLARQSGGGQIPLTVACFDQTVEPIFEGPVSAFGDDAVRRIRARKALGASDLSRALNWVAGRKSNAPAKRVWLLTDGVATAGKTEGQDLVTAALALRSKGVTRIDAIALGGIRDEATLARVVTAGLAHDGVVADGAAEPAAVLTKLTQQTHARMEVKVADAHWFWPRTLAGVQPGDEVLVYADLPASVSVNISIGGKRISVAEPTPVERPLLERSFVQAQINSLVQRLEVDAKTATEKSALRAEIVGLSVGHRVLSPYTALLILESEQDYARFGIDRNALADISVVNDAGQLALSHRAAGALALAPNKRVPDTKGDALKPMAKRKETSFREDDRAAPGDEASSTKAGPPEEEKSLADVGSSVGGASTGAGRAAASQNQPAPQPSAGPSAPPSPVQAEPAPNNASGERRVTGSRQEIIQIIRGGNEYSAPTANEERGVDPYTGRFKIVMDAIAKGDNARALSEASGWHEEDPGDVMALVAFGTALEKTGDLSRAARAYGSIIDLFPARADLRRFAGERLEHLSRKAGLELAVDTFAKAAIQRPDHPASHRLLAFALLRQGLLSQAFEAAATGARQKYPEGRFAGADRILREDLGLIAAAWIKAQPSKREVILGRLHAEGGTVEDAPSLRFILNWETDANDVDFHIHDARGNHAFYSAPHLATGGDLYADVTTGYGPECFTIRLAPSERTYPYRLQAHYYSRGPMGYGMGKLQIIDHDGHGGLTFDERPFVVMVDQAFVDMGTVQR